jgi:hypothetical protein
MNLKRNAMKAIAITLLLALATEAQAWYGQEKRYGNPYGNDSNSYRLYSPDGSFHGNLNDNRYDRNSVSNPYGRYGSRYSPDSINNPYRIEPLRRW